MKKLLFIKNAVVLTATSLFLRMLGVIFRIWLSGKIGSEGIGLYQIIFSFYILAATFATSGINIAVTRLVSEETCVGNSISIKRIMRSSFFVISLVAIVTSLTIFLAAAPIAKYIVADIRSTAAIKTLSFSLLSMGISSCIKGYFLARRKTVPPSCSQIIEQIVRMLSVMFLVKQFAPQSIELACAAVLAGDVIAEFFSCLYLYVYYLKDIRSLNMLRGRSAPNFSVFKKIMHISLPITGGKYINSFLRIIESALVPNRLVLSGCTRSAALSFFGMIKGMALPILFFPSALLGSLSTLLIPEVSEATAKGYAGTVRRSVEKIVFATMLFGFLFAAIFFFCGENLGNLIYKSQEVGVIIKILAPIVPLMYLDSICDGILKGLDQQAATFLNSVSDSAARIVLIYFLLPIYKEPAFIFIMYLSNLYTCLLNLIRLLGVSGARILLFRQVILPLLWAISGTFFITSICNIVIPKVLFNVIIVALGSTLVYFGGLFAFGCIKKEEMRII